MLTSLRMMSGKDCNKKQYTKNLLYNGDCSLDTLYWKSWAQSFKLHKNSYTKENIIKFHEENSDKNKWYQCWSTDVENSGLNDTYTVSFDCRIINESLLANDKIIFAIRTFDKKNLCSQKDSVQDIRIKRMEMNESEFVHYEYDFIPKGKYISVGPFITRNGHVEWKNIQLCKKSQEELTHQEYRKSVSEELLLDTRDSLIDVNNIQIVNRRQLIQ